MNPNERTPDEPFEEFKLRRKRAQNLERYAQPRTLWHSPSHGTYRKTQRYIGSAETRT